MKKFFVLVLSCLMLSVSFIQAQDLQFTKQMVKDLSSPEMYGRGYAYNGDSIAADYLRNKMVQLQLEPLCPDFYQNYTFNSFGMEGPVALWVNGSKLEIFQDFRVCNFSKSFDGVATLLRFDVNNICDSAKIVAFCNKYQSQLSNAFVYIDMTKLNKKKFADKEKEKALNMALRTLSSKNPFRSAGLMLGVGNLPIWSFNGSDFERDYTMIYILPEKISNSTKSVSVKVNNRFHSHKTQNVCGMIKGEVEPDTMIVFTAHYDHIGQMGDDAIFAGANDNASGAAMVLDFARHYKINHPYYTTVFCEFSGEEAGLRGSFEFVKNPPVDLSKIKFVINLDLLGSGEEGITVVNSTEGITKTYFDEMTRINDEKHYLTAVKARKQTANSDHYPFSMNKVPAVFIYAMGKTGSYHHVNDTFENCSFGGYESIFKLFVDLINVLPKM